jgi:hypothetical protein
MLIVRRLLPCRTLLLPCLIALLVGAAGCADDAHEAQPPLPPCLYPGQNSPASCLTTFRKTYQERSDIAEYAKLLTPDFSFVFSPNDSAGLNPTPGHWGLADELESAGNMFNSELLTSVSLRFLLGDPVQSDQYPGTWKVEMTSIELRLETRRQDGSPLTVLVSDGHSTFYLKEFPDETTRCGGPIWRIRRWEDHGLGPATTAALGLGREKTTWGQIKARYHG